MRLPKPLSPAALLAYAITTAESNAQPRNTTAKPSADLFIDDTSYHEQPQPSTTTIHIMRLENYCAATTRYTRWKDKDDNSRKAKPFTYSPKRNQRQRRRDSRRRN